MIEVPATLHPGTSPQALFDEVYSRLKAMAGRQRARSGAPLTLGTTELVHELYLRMVHAGEKRFEEPVQFFAYAARAMRNILIDAARSRNQEKAGGDLQRISLTDPAVGAVEIDPARALLLDRALERLESEDARAARVVELHYFAGLSMQQIADLLGVVRRTVDRDWRYARAFLMAQIE
jgi:RNA polymerase sigma factor (TIGR02999 family)